MKAILLAAGRSFRMQPVQDKNFLKFLGTPIIESQIAALKRAGFKEILVVGGNHNFARLKELKGVELREQKDLGLGMAGAVLTAETWLNGDPFLLVSGNDVVSDSAFALIKRNIKAGEGLMLAYEVSQYFPGGYLRLAEGENRITKIVEKPGRGKEPSSLVNIVMHYHARTAELVRALKVEVAGGKKKSQDDIYERALQALFDAKIAYRAVPYKGFWQPLKFPWHVLALMANFLDFGTLAKGGVKKGKGVKIAKSATVDKNVILSDGVKVMENAVIKGPSYIGKNTVIATNALVRESNIGENCVIGFGSEVARSFIGDNVWTHTNYVGDSIIGSNVAFGAGTVTGNLRLDEQNVRVAIEKTWNGHKTIDKIDTGFSKLGLITGDNIRIGVNSSMMPGIKIGSGSFVGAGIVIFEDVPAGSYVTGDWILKIKKNKAEIKPRAL